MKKTTLGIIMAASMFAACKKDEKKEAPGASTVTGKALMAHGWIINKYTIKLDMEGSTEMDGTTMFPACALDNILHFQSDGSIMTEEGATKCVAGSPDKVTSGTWELRSGETQLFMAHVITSRGVEDITEDILQLDETTLKVRYYVTSDLPGTIPAWNEITYTAVK